MAAPPSVGPVITVPPLHECETVIFKWASTAGPFKVWLWAGTGGMGTILADFGNLANTEQGFSVDLAKGYEVQLAVRDAAGHTSNSAPMTVLSGECPANIKLRNPAPIRGIDDESPKASPTASPPAPVVAPSPATSTKAVDPAAPTTPFSPAPSKAAAKTELSSIPQFTGTDPTRSPNNPAAAVDTIVRAGGQRPVPSTQAAASTNTAMVPTETPIGPFVPIGTSSILAAISPSGQPSSVSYYTSASSTFPIIPIHSESSSQSEQKSNATMIAGIAGGVTCAILFFGLIFWVLCRHRRQNKQFGDRTDDDYVHFDDSASTGSFPPIYAAFRSESNLAGRGAGGGGVEAEGAGDRRRSGEYEKADMAVLGGSSILPDLEHIPYSNPSIGQDANDNESEISPHDMGSRPILDPAILGRSAPKLPKSPARSTWRSSFGAVFSWMAPVSPMPSAFGLRGRGSRRYDGDTSETLTSMGVSRTNTLRTERSGGASTFAGPAISASGQGANADPSPPSYRASVSTFANLPSSPLFIANPSPAPTPTSAALAVLTSAATGSSRILLPRRLSGATVQTARSRRSIATFGAADVALLPHASLRSPSSAHSSGMAPIMLLSPGSDDSFGDLGATELAYVQPGLAGSSSIRQSGDLASYQLPPIPTSYVGIGEGTPDQPYGRAEGVLSRVSVGRFERPRTLMFTRDSLAASAFGGGSSVASPPESGFEGKGDVGSASGEHEEKEAEVRPESGASGRWAEMRMSLRKSFGGRTDDGVGQAI